MDTTKSKDAARMETPGTDGAARPWDRDWEREAPAPFDPDAYLAGGAGDAQAATDAARPWERDWEREAPTPFDPDAYLAGGAGDAQASAATARPWERDWEREAPAPFEPDAYLVGGAGDAQAATDAARPWERDWEREAPTPFDPDAYLAGGAGDTQNPGAAGGVYVRPARPGDAMDAQAERRTREALAAGDVREAQDWARMRAERDTGVRDLDTARAKEAAIRAPYLVIRGAAGGVTLGLSEPVLAALERELGGRVRAETTVEALGEGAARLLGGVFAGQGLARGLQSLTARLGLSGVKQLLAVRLAASGVQSALSSLGSVAAGDATLKDAAGNVAQALGASLVGMLPENLLRGGIGNWAGQILTDFAYDFATDAGLRGRLKDRRFVDWLVADELPQLVMSVAFATRDLTDANFEAQRQIVRAQLFNGVLGRARGIPPNASATATGGEAQRAGAPEGATAAGGAEPEPAGRKMRGTAERLAQDPGNEGLRIGERPGSYHDPLSITARRQAYANMGDDSLLLAAGDESNPYRAMDRAEYYSRLFSYWTSARSSGNEAEAARLRERIGLQVDAMAADATSAAQYLRFMQEVRLSSPAAAVDFAESLLRKRGYTLTERQRESLLGAAVADMEARATLRDAESAAKDGPADEGRLTEYAQALSAAQKAHQRFADEVAAYTPRTWPELIRAFRSGNLLRGTTHVVNTAANLVMGTIGDAAQDLGAAGNILLHYASGKLVRRTGGFVNPLDRMRGAVAGLARGVTEAVRGARPDFGAGGNVTEFDERSLHPVRALRHAFGRGLGMAASAETGRVPVGDRVKKLAEAFMGAYPELNFRLLRAEDLVFRESRYTATLRELGRKRGLTGAELRRFEMLPPEAERQTAVAEALADVFQGGAGAALNRGLSQIRKAGMRIGGATVGDWVDAFVVHGLKPYTTTPVNVLVTGLKLSNPGLAMGVGVARAVEARRLSADAVRAEQAGNSVKAKLLRGQAEAAMRRAYTEGIGYAAIGAAMNMAAAALFNAGVIAPPASRDEKLRELERRTGHPGKLNRSALGRLLAGGDPAPRDGDVWIDLAVTGFFGLNAAVVSGRMRDLQAAGVDPRSRDMLTQAWDGLAGASASFANGTLQLPMLQASWDLLRGLYQGDERATLRLLWQSVTGTVMPGVLDQYSRSRQEAIPDTYSADALQALRNAVVASNPLVDWETAFPARRTPLGEIVRRTPAGVPTFWYHMLDASKAAPGVTPEPVWQEIGKLWGETRMPEAIPGMPDRTFSVRVPDGPHRGKDVVVEIAPAEYAEFMETVGRRRMEAYAMVTESRSYRRASSVEKVQFLARAWSKGAEVARAEWYQAQRKSASQFVRRIDAALSAEGARGGAGP